MVRYPVDGTSQVEAGRMTFNSITLVVFFTIFLAFWSQPFG